MLRWYIHIAVIFARWNILTGNSINKIKSQVLHLDKKYGEIRIWKIHESVRESHVYRRSSDVSRLRGIHIYSICLSVGEYDLLEDSIDIYLSGASFSPTDFKRTIFPVEINCVFGIIFHNEIRAPIL